MTKGEEEQVYAQQHNSGKLKPRRVCVTVTDGDMRATKEDELLRQVSSNVLRRACRVCKHDLCWCCVAAVGAHRMDSVLTVLTARRASAAGHWPSSTRVLALSSVSLHKTTSFSCSSLSHLSLFCLFSSNFFISFSFFLRAERSLRLHTPRA